MHPHLPVANREAGVADAGLLDPRPPAQDYAVLVVVHCGEEAVPPFPDSLVRDATHLGADSSGTANRARLTKSAQIANNFLQFSSTAPVSEVNSAARGAASPPDTQRGEDVPPERRLPAARAGRMVPIELGRPNERADADLLVEYALSLETM